MSASEERLNQAIATVQGRMTPEGLIIHGKTVAMSISPTFHRWKRTKMLPLEYESRFRVWPRTNQSGELSDVCVVSVNPPRDVEGSIIAGRVSEISEDRIIIRVTPERRRRLIYDPRASKGFKPFNVVVFDEHPEQCPLPGWWVQCLCELTAENHFRLTSWRSLKHLLAKNKASKNEEEPEPEKQAEAVSEMNPEQGPETAIEHQGNASPSPVVPELTPEMQACLQQARALFERAKLATSPADKAQLEAIARQILEESNIPDYFASPVL